MHKVKQFLRVVFIPVRNNVFMISLHKEKTSCAYNFICISRARRIEREPAECTVFRDREVMHLSAQMQL